ncbi:hypothetical protein OESDEN_09147 [Oesophagostomum dentatum]|uniref:Uncharacterized protein n=1 Tax=Oesophagostomum dentatum TaxID=61180 RepID=A0A0B1T4B8_OESDE|nr:hypothetical protein OESDEN_09147 [Oesophagostomum dentatum]
MMFYFLIFPIALILGGPVGIEQSGQGQPPEMGNQPGGMMGGAGGMPNFQGQMTGQPPQNGHGNGQIPSQ